jgi:tetratricopeptide (TPR) repeat protein
VGYGPGHYGTSFLLYSDADVLHTRFAHQFILEKLTEAGVIGLFLWLAWFLKAFMETWRLRLDRVTRSWETAALAGATALFAHNMLDYSLAIPAVTCLFWFFVGSSITWKNGQETSFPPLFRTLSIALFFSIGVRLAELSRAERAIEHAQESLESKQFDRAKQALARIHEDSLPRYFNVLGDVYWESYRLQARRGDLAQALIQKKRAAHMEGNNPVVFSDVAYLSRLYGDRENFSKFQIKLRKLVSHSTYLKKKYEVLLQL